MSKKGFVWVEAPRVGFMLESAYRMGAGSYFWVFFMGWVKCFHIPWLKVDPFPVKDFVDSDGNPFAYLRKFGIVFSSRAVDLYYGTQFPNAEMHVYQYYPWIYVREVWTKFYDPDGKLHSTTLNVKQAVAELGYIRQLMRKEDECPKRIVTIRDNHDGEVLVAKYFIEEKGYQPGYGWFRYIFRVRVDRTLRITYSSEVGPGKGSYKGGDVRATVALPDYDDADEAFCHHCSKNNLTVMFN